jgi:hypothetical protein
MPSAAAPSWCNSASRRGHDGVPPADQARRTRAKRNGRSAGWPSAANPPSALAGKNLRLVDNFGSSREAIPMGDQFSTTLGYRLPHYAPAPESVKQRGVNYSPHLEFDTSDGVSLLSIHRRGSARPPRGPAGGLEWGR